MASQSEKAKVLELVNRVREVFDEPALDNLPKGRPDAHSCPLQRALPHCECISHSYIEFHNVSMDKQRSLADLLDPDYEFCSATLSVMSALPPEIFRNFMTDFDEARYPELLQGDDD